MSFMFFFFCKLTLMLHTWRKQGAFYVLNTSVFPASDFSLHIDFTIYQMKSCQAFSLIILFYQYFSTKQMYHWDYKLRAFFVSLYKKGFDTLDGALTKSSLTSTIENGFFYSSVVSVLCFKFPTTSCFTFQSAVCSCCWKMLRLFLCLSVYVCSCLYLSTMFQF